MSFYKNYEGRPEGRLRVEVLDFLWNQVCSANSEIQTFPKTRIKAMKAEINRVFQSVYKQLLRLNIKRVVKCIDLEYEKLESDEEILTVPYRDISKETLRDIWRELRETDQPFRKYLLNVDIDLPDEFWSGYVDNLRTFIPTRYHYGPKRKPIEIKKEEDLFLEEVFYSEEDVGVGPPDRLGLFK